VARFGTAFPTFGAGTELLAISACVIGGASLAGGAGTILGSVIGIALLAIVTTSLILLDISVYWQELVSGLILLFAVLLDYLTNMRSK
jgi:ribose transport system permease protein